MPYLTMSDGIKLYYETSGEAHAIWNQMPHEVAEAVKKFINEH